MASCSSSNTSNRRCRSAERAYVLNHGDLVLSGDTATLRQDRSLLEASYLGDTAH